MIKSLGTFTGKERGYHRAYPSTTNVSYRIYDVDGKEYGVPVKSSHTIETLIEMDKQGKLFN